MKLILEDYIMIVASCLSFLEKLITNAIVTMSVSTAYPGGSGEAVSKVIDAVEINPLIGFLLKSQSLGSFFVTIMVPALTLAFYLYVRRLYIKKYNDQYHRMLLTFSVNFFALVMLGVFMQNMGIYVGFLTGI